MRSPVGNSTAPCCDFAGKTTKAGPPLLKEYDTIATPFCGAEPEHDRAYSDSTPRQLHRAYSNSTPRRRAHPFPFPKSTCPEAAATVSLACFTAQLALFSKHYLASDRSSFAATRRAYSSGMEGEARASVCIDMLFSLRSSTRSRAWRCARCSTMRGLRRWGRDHVVECRSEGVVGQI